MVVCGELIGYRGRLRPPASQSALALSGEIEQPECSVVSVQVVETVLVVRDVVLQIDQLFKRLAVLFSATIHQQIDVVALLVLASLRPERCAVGQCVCQLLKRVSHWSLGGGVWPVFVTGAEMIAHR